MTYAIFRLNLTKWTMCRDIVVSDVRAVINKITPKLWGAEKRSPFCKPLKMAPKIGRSADCANRVSDRAAELATSPATRREPVAKPAVDPFCPIDQCETAAECGYAGRCLAGKTSTSTKCHQTPCRHAVAFVGTGVNIQTARRVEGVEAASAPEPVPMENAGSGAPARDSLPNNRPIALRLTADQATIILAWWCEELLELLLRPVWLRYVDSFAAGDTRTAERRFLAFSRLVNATPCWPCRVSYSPSGPLWITRSTEAVFDEADWMAAFSP